MMSPPDQSSRVYAGFFLSKNSAGLVIAGPPAPRKDQRQEDQESIDLHNDDHCQERDLIPGQRFAKWKNLHGKPLLHSLPRLKVQFLCRWWSSEQGPKSGQIMGWMRLLR